MSNGQSEIQLASQALAPFFPADVNGERKAEYLSYRFTGFTVREAVALSHLHEWDPRRWRQRDPVFADLEQQATGPRRGEIRREVLQNLFLRNYRRVLEKDAQVIEHSLSEPDTMSKGDFDYLVRMRAHYTPQQLQILEGLLKPNAFNGQDISRLIMEAFSQSPDGQVNQRRLEIDVGT